jgi:hypothetical protein
MISCGCGCGLLLCFYLLPSCEFHLFYRSETKPNKPYLVKHNQIQKD